MNQHALSNDACVTGNRLIAHILLERRLAAERNSCKRVHREVYEQQLNYRHDDVLAQHRTKEAGKHRCYIDRQLEDEELANTLEHRTTVEDSLLNGEEVIIQNRDVTSFLRDLGTAAHSEADVGFLEGWAVVHTVAAHPDNEINFLRKTR